MKKFVLYLAVFLVCAISVYPLAAGAWGPEDIDGSEITYDNTLPISFASSVDANGDTVWQFYDTGEVPVGINVNFDNVSTNFKLWKIEDLTFQKDHGLFFVNTSSFLVNFDYSLVLFFYADHDGYFTRITFYTDGTYYVAHSPFGSCFSNDFSVFYTKDDTWRNVGVSGTLNGDLTRVAAFIYPSDGIVLNGFYNYQGHNAFAYTRSSVVPAVVENVTVSPSSPAPYYPGTYVQMQADVIGTGSYDPSVSWSVDSGLSGGVTIDENGLFYIPTDEQALSVEVTAASVADPNISGAYTVDITYPLQGVTIVPSGQEFYPFSSKDRTIQYSLLLPNGDPYDYDLLTWIIEPTAGAAEYYSVDDAGLVTIKGGAPVGSGYTLKWAYLWDADNPSPDSVSFSVISNDESIQEELDDYINGDHGFDSSGSDFSGAAGDLQNSSNQMNNAMSGGMNHLGAMMNSVDFTTTLTTLGSGMDALFEGHEVTICGVTANPFELVVTIVAIAILLPLALKFIFRKWGSGSSGGGSDA